MSRFSVKKGKYDNFSLDQKQLSFLQNHLLNHINKELKKLAESEIKRMKKNGKKYRLITPDEQFVILISKDYKKESKCCIGYPFPIAQFDIENVSDEFSVKYFIRGKKLREFQFKHLINLLSKRYSVKNYEFSSKKDFKEELDKHINDFVNKDLYYLDYYNFLGDSYLSSYMLDAFVNKYKFKNIKYISKNAEHLALDYSTINMRMQSDNYSHKQNVYVVADLLDIDDGYVQKFLFNKNNNGIFILLSRNTFIIKNKDTIEIYKYKKNDVLLIKNNIFDYMDKCINCFGLKLQNLTKEKVSKLQKVKVYINPYASSDEKSLTEEEIIQLIKYLNKKNFKIYFPYGHNDATIELTKKVCNKVEGLELIKSKNLIDFYKLISKKQINLVITVDTSITHLMTKKKIINFVIYKDGFWDDESYQSLSAESPIGFCSYSPYQLPIFYKNSMTDTIDELNALLSEIVQSFENVKEKRYKDYNELLSKFKTDDISILKDSAYRIGIKAKINNYK